MIYFYEYPPECGKIVEQTIHVPKCGTYGVSSKLQILEANLESFIIDLSI